MYGSHLNVVICSTQFSLQRLPVLNCFVKGGNVNPVQL